MHANDLRLIEAGGESAVSVTVRRLCNASKTLYARRTSETGRDDPRAVGMR